MGAFSFLFLLSFFFDLFVFPFLFFEAVNYFITNTQKMITKKLKKQKLQVLTLKSLMPWGKYFGKSIEYLIHIDKRYVENLYIYEKFEFESNVKVLLNLTRNIKKTEQEKAYFSRASMARRNQGHKMNATQILDNIYLKKLPKFE